MTFSNNDLKRIAKNLVSIRKAYGCKTQLDFALALDENARYPGLSHDMIKKYESGSYPITEKTLRLISSLTLIPFEDIVYENLDYLEPNSFVLGNETNIHNEFLEIVDNGEFDIKGLFPLFSNKDLLVNKSFAQAMIICDTKLNIAAFNEGDLVDAIELFLDNPISESYLNIMSLLGRLYITYIYKGISTQAFEKIKSKNINNPIDYAKELREGIRHSESQMINVKKKYLEVYNKLLTDCMREAVKEDKYKDYVYYYLGVRYYFGIMDNEITKFSDDEMNSFGINMLDCLSIIGNKYAKEFKKIMRE